MNVKRFLILCIITPVYTVEVLVYLKKRVSDHIAVISCIQGILFSATRILNSINSSGIWFLKADWILVLILCARLMRKGRGLRFKMEFECMQFNNSLKGKDEKQGL